MSDRKLSISELDAIGIRVFVRYATGSGYYAVEAYRKKLQHESEGSGDWRMIRHGHIQTYGTRKEAENVAVVLGNSIYRELFAPENKVSNTLAESIAQFFKKIFKGGKP